MKTGGARWKSEISTIDTTYLLAGALTAGMYFDRDTKKETEIRTLAEALYARADWQWAQNGALTVSHGWKPETGFIKYRWDGYSEALILYVLGLASPDFPASRGELSRPGPGRTNGRNFTGRSFSTPVRSSFITSRTCGSIFAASRTNTCAARRSTISRTAAARSMRSRRMRCAIRKSLPVTENRLGNHGERWPGTGPAQDQRQNAGILRLHSAQHSLWS